MTSTGREGCAPMTPDLIARLRELDAAATPGPWAYRPDEYDDWGVVKSPRVPVDGFPDGLRCVLAQFRHPESIHDEEVLNEHRRAKTDPWQGNAELVTFLRNAVPEILEAADQLEALRSHAEAMFNARDNWDGLARAIMMGFDCDCRTPSKLFKHLVCSGHEVPDWMREEPELQFADHTISKGTRCVLIYRAMSHDAAAAYRSAFPEVG